MKRLIIFLAILCFSTLSQAQKLSLTQLEQILNASVNETVENLFLVGYQSISESPLADSAGIVYYFSNRKNTITTAKKVTKVVHFKEAVNSYIQYVTYDRAEFLAFRRLMIEEQFTRSSRDSISESASYTKNTQKVNFEAQTDEYGNKLYVITLQGSKAKPLAKMPKRIDLKSVFKQ